MNPNLVIKIDDAVESVKDELIEFLSEIIQIPTQNPPGNNYETCAEAIGKMMEKIGMDVEYVSVPKEELDELAPHGQGLPRVSVIGKMPGEEVRPNIHFTGHFDVVPEGTDWTVDPYGGDVIDGKIYGRGASDQKSGIAAQIFAIYALKKAGIKLKGTLISSATPDEESGGNAGVGYLVDQGYINSDKTDYCVITECLGVEQICLGHRGAIWFEVETMGKQAHTLQPSKGINAIENALLFINEANKEILPLLEDKVDGLAPEGCQKSTLTFTMIHSGEKVNTVPASCKVTADWRLVTGMTKKWAMDTIIDICEGLKKEHENFDYKFKLLMGTDSILVPKDTDVVKAFQKSGKEYLGKEMNFTISPGTDDQKYIVGDGKMDQCIVFGPGPLETAHISDEYVPVDDLVNATKIMALAAVELLGIDE